MHLKTIRKSFLAIIRASQLLKDIDFSRDRALELEKVEK